MANEEQLKSSLDLPIFTLSGGLMRASVTGNRIDGLLSKMIQSPDAVRYVRNVDRNLDYLITSLQLDMIKIMAEESSQRAAPRQQGSLRMEIDRYLDTDEDG